MSQRVPFLEIIYYVAKNSNKKIPFSQDYKAAHGAIKQLILFQESWEKKKVLPHVYVSANCSGITSLTKRKKTNTTMSDNWHPTFHIFQNRSTKKY